MNSPSFLDLLVPALLGGAVASLITAFLTPTLQHYFWRRQRHAEICLSLIKDLTLHWSKFIEIYVSDWDEAGAADLTPAELHDMNGFLLSWAALAEQTKSLFSAKSWNAFAPFFNSVRGIVQHIVQRDPHALAEVGTAEMVQIKERAFDALYRELGLARR